jgi:acetylornithine deacetylase
MPAQNLSDKLGVKTITRLQRLIAIPSFSRQEQHAVAVIESFLKEEGISFQRKGNNVWASNRYFDPAKPTLLLNSHIDTVKPNSGYTLDPFEPLMAEDKLYGLGSNDAGGPLLSLLAVFTHYYSMDDLKYNLIYAATAEEEISGKNGIESILAELGSIDFAIVGEPTGMHLAIAEKGLIVLDCTVTGKAGHAAREEGENAIYKAMKDIEWFRSFRFPKESETLGAVKMSVTMIESGSQHNVVPATCTYTVDLRTTDVYTHEEILTIIQQHISADVHARSMRLKPSAISKEHPFVQAGISLGRKTYGSPTISDQALMPFPSVKLGPGDSARSHQADEFINLSEITEGIAIYIQLLNQILK